MRAEEEERLRKLVAAGEQVNAERLYQELTGDPSESGLRQALAVSDVRRLLASGQRIEAIKIYREAFACSLIEAQKEVQALAGKRPTPPSPAHPLTSGKGMPLVILVACLALMIIAALALRLFVPDEGDDTAPIPPPVQSEQAE